MHGMIAIVFSICLLLKQGFEVNAAIYVLMFYQTVIIRINVYFCIRNGLWTINDR